MKYGINAYDGNSGIKSHIEHLQAILGDKDKKQKLNELIAAQFNQLVDLELVKFNPNADDKTSHGKRGQGDVRSRGNPEVVMLLANHNPRSKKLLNILKTIEEPAEFDLRFFNASFAGYGMHEACMLRLRSVYRAPRGLGRTEFRRCRPHVSARRTANSRSEASVPKEFRGCIP